MRCCRYLAWVAGLFVAFALTSSGLHAVQGIQGGQSETVAVVGGFLIDGNGGPPVEDAVVIIEGDRITQVGTVADTEVPAEAEVIDANGFTVLPGLHDVHVHLMVVGHGVYSEYFPRYRDRMRELMPISARQLLLSGVTSARDVGGPLEESLWLKRQIESGELPGPRLFVSGPFVQKTTSGYDDWFRWTVDGASDARQKIRRLLDAGVDFIKVTQLSQMTAAEREAIGSVAKEAGVHIAGHAWGLEEHRMAVEMGMETIEHLGAGSKPAYRPESLRILADNGIIFVPTNVVMRVYDVTQAYPEHLDDQQLKADLPSDVYQDVRKSIRYPSRLGYFDRAKARYDESNWGGKTKQLYNAGVQLLVGTDAGTPMNFHYEATWREMALLVKYGVPPMEVISAATRLPAELYGVGDDLGTLEPGKYADLIVVDGNPLESMTALKRRSIVHILKGGVQYK